jgi:hypothetical protein
LQPAYESWMQIIEPWTLEEDVWKAKYCEDQFKGKQEFHEVEGQLERETGEEVTHFFQKNRNVPMTNQHFSVGKRLLI